MIKYSSCFRGRAREREPLTDLRECFNGPPALLLAQTVEPALHVIHHRALDLRSPRRVVRMVEGLEDLVYSAVQIERAPRIRDTSEIKKRQIGAYLIYDSVCIFIIGPSLKRHTQTQKKLLCIHVM